MKAQNIILTVVGWAVTALFSIPPALADDPEAELKGGFDPCECYSCIDCEATLSDPDCIYVILAMDIISEPGTCIDWPAGADGKTFDGNGHLIEGDVVGRSQAPGDGSAVRVIGATGGAVINLDVAYMTYGVYLDNTSDFLVANCVFSDLGADPAHVTGEGVAIKNKYPGNNVVRNNQFFRNNHCAVVTNSTSHNTIMDNVLAENYCAMSLQTDSTDNHVLRNEMYLHPC